MTYAQHLTLMTRALVDVARHGQHDLTDAEKGLALFARRGVLELLNAVHTDLTGLTAARTVIGIGDLETHPVAALAQALGRHPRLPTDQAPSDALTTPTTTDAGRAWHEVARQAVLAHHHWTAGNGPRADVPTTWAGVADIAAVARQLAALDVELAEVLHQGGPRWQPTAVGLARGATSGLGVAARETAQLAASGPIADAGPDRGADLVVRRRILMARSAAELPGTLRRFGEFLDGAVNVRPERLGHLAAAIARCALLAREQLPAGDPAATALRGELREHARLLREVGARPGGVVSLDPGDLRPLRQAAEAYQGTRRHGAGLAGDRRLLGEYVRALAASTQALGAVVDRSMGTRRWLVPDRSSSLIEPVWGRLRADMPVPHPVLAVRAAVAQSVTLRQVVEEWLVPGITPSLRAVREALAARPEVVGRPPREVVGSPPREVVGEVAARRPRLPSYPVTPWTATRRR